MEEIQIIADPMNKTDKILIALLRCTASALENLYKYTP